jgi:hypothetical protein
MSLCIYSHRALLPAQAKNALHHPYFDNLDKEPIDALENPDLAALEEEAAGLEGAGGE